MKNITITPDVAEDLNDMAKHMDDMEKGEASYNDIIRRLIDESSNPTEEDIRAEQARLSEKYGGGASSESVASTSTTDKSEKLESKRGDLSPTEESEAKAERERLRQKYLE